MASDEHWGAASAAALQKNIPFLVTSRPPERIHTYSSVGLLLTGDMHAVAFLFGLKAGQRGGGSCGEAPGRHVGGGTPGSRDRHLIQQEEGNSSGAVLSEGNPGGPVCNSAGFRGE